MLFLLNVKLFKFYFYDHQSHSHIGKIKKRNSYFCHFVLCAFALNIKRNVNLLADKCVSLINFSTHDILHFYLRFLSNIFTIPSLYSK